MFHFYYSTVVFWFLEAAAQKTKKLNLKPVWSEVAVPVHDKCKDIFIFNELSFIKDNEPCETS